jgi:cell division protein ZipA
MPELRWTLLILGALFIAALAWWELRRQRQAPRQGVGQGTHPGAHTGASRDAERSAPPAEASGEVRGHREPTISFPELQPADARSEARAPMRGREPTPDPRVVELDGDSFAGLRVEAETDDPVKAAAPVRIGAIPPVPPRTFSTEVDDPPTVRMDASSASEQGASVGYTRHEEYSDETPADEAGAGAESADEERGSESTPVGAAAAGEPIVDWPREEARKIIALRLVSAPAARFSGRSVRLALAAEGFVLGKFEIFHKPGPDARAVLSAASLTKPGTFALNSIDGQRFGGLSLFAVLPGPLPARQTFDELLATARSLNDRLQGALQDERGEPLTPMRSASIREGLSNGNGAAGRGGGHHAGGHGAGGGGRATPGGAGGTPHAEPPQ